MLRIDRRTDSLLFFFFTNIEKLYRYYVNHKWEMLCSSIHGDNLYSTGVVQFAIYTKWLPKEPLPPSPHPWPTCTYVPRLHSVDSSFHSAASMRFPEVFAKAKTTWVHRKGSTFLGVNFPSPVLYCDQFV